MCLYCRSIKGEQQIMFALHRENIALEIDIFLNGW